MFIVMKNFGIKESITIRFVLQNDEKTMEERRYYNYNELNIRSTRTKLSIGLKIKKKEKSGKI